MIRDMQVNERNIGLGFALHERNNCFDL